MPRRTSNRLTSGVSAAWARRTSSLACAEASETPIERPL